MMKPLCCLALVLSVLMVPTHLAAQLAPTRVDLEKPVLTGPLALTLSEAVSLALERNPSLKVEKIRIEQSRARILQEKGAFDTLFNLKGSAARRDNVVASRFYPTGFYSDSEQAPGVSLEGRTQNGARYTAAFDYKRLLSTSNTQTLSPQYSGNLTLSLVQPLLRDFGKGVNKTRIRLAEKTSEIAEKNLFQRISQLIQSVEESYWNLVFLRENLDGKKRSLDIAQGLLTQSQELLRAGIVAPVSVLEAQSGVAAREEEVITAEGDMRRFEDRLKLLLWLDLSRSDLTPRDAPLEDDVQIDEAAILDNAYRQRPEILGLQKEVEQREIELNYASNQTKPRLDLTAQYGQIGISGRPNTVCIDPNALICEPVGNSVSGSIFAGLTQPDDPFSRMFSRHPFDNWTVEMKLQIPLGNRTAEARKSEANLQLLETGTRLRAIRDQIAMETRDAIREMQTSRKRIDAARESIRFLEDQLDGTRKRLEAGLASSYDVLRVLAELDKARTNERRAMMDYNVGRSKLAFAEASNLAKYNVELTTAPPRYVFDTNNPR
jgi:outer membrane protein